MKKREREENSKAISEKSKTILPNNNFLSQLLLW